MRLIDADALFEEMERIDTQATGNGLVAHGAKEFRLLCGQAIDAAPTIDAEPVRHGRIITPKRWGEWARCNLCDGTVPIIYNYCPHCGAKMDGETE